jgi:hypothetical protein
MFLTSENKLLFDIKQWKYIIKRKADLVESINQHILAYEECLLALQQSIGMKKKQKLMDNNIKFNEKSPVSMDVEFIEQVSY